MEIRNKRVKTSKRGQEVVLFSDYKALKGVIAVAQKAIKPALDKKSAIFPIANNDKITWLCLVPNDDAPSSLEKVRKLGFAVYSKAKAEWIDALNIQNLTGSKRVSSSLQEGLGLSAYRFERHLKKPSDYFLKQVEWINDPSSAAEMKETDALVQSVYWTRDLVNEPLSHLTATDLANSFREEGKKDGFKVEIFRKKRIETLKMGGILAVNRGSIDPPTFSILTWKHPKAKNKKPIVLVGKGVVYDTGGLSLKPTANSMDFMKSDMGGAAMMAGVIKAAAKNDLPIHLVALIPASDNRPGVNAYAPGDIITMFDGTTVEVRNTDAEGRLLMADALTYAKKLKPQLVMDAATLTGAAVRAVGTKASCVMGTADDSSMKRLKEASEETYERVVEFPLWDEYGEEMKSPIADLNNLGGPYAGQITAGKFLQHFTDYPWIHFDIAGPSFMHSPSSYLGQGGTGVGVRLLYTFLKKQING